MTYFCLPLLKEQDVFGTITGATYQNAARRLPYPHFTPIESGKAVIIWYNLRVIDALSTLRLIEKTRPHPFAHYLQTGESIKVVLRIEGRKPDISFIQRQDI